MNLWYVGFSIWIICAGLYIKEQIMIRKQKSKLTPNSWIYLVVMWIGLLIMRISH